MPSNGECSNIDKRNQVKFMQKYSYDFATPSVLKNKFFNFNVWICFYLNVWICFYLLLWRLIYLKFYVVWVDFHSFQVKLGWRNDWMIVRVWMPSTTPLYRVTVLGWSIFWSLAAVNYSLTGNQAVLRIHFIFMQRLLV